MPPEPGHLGPVSPNFLIAAFDATAAPLLRHFTSLEVTNDYLARSVGGMLNNCTKLESLHVADLSLFKAVRTSLAESVREVVLDRKSWSMPLAVRRGEGEPLEVLLDH